MANAASTNSYSTPAVGVAPTLYQWGYETSENNTASHSYRSSNLSGDNYTLHPVPRPAAPYPPSPQTTNINDKFWIRQSSTGGLASEDRYLIEYHSASPSQPPLGPSYLPLVTRKTSREASYPGLTNANPDRVHSQDRATAETDEPQTPTRPLLLLEYPPIYQHMSDQKNDEKVDITKGKNEDEVDEARQGDEEDEFRSGLDR